MSEYQYYEFVAVEQPLSRSDMAALRACSSRAMITPTSFINEYNWGDLNADPADWMRRYFDLFFYDSNFGSWRLSVRLPRAALDKEVLEQFATVDELSFDDTGTHWIVTWSIEEEGGDSYDVEGGGGWTARLLPLRDELLRGDLRPLYLGWLAGVSAGYVEDDEPVPPIPPGMSTLSAAQQSLAEFLGVDPDLLAATAAASPDVDLHVDDDDSVEVWMGELRANEIRTVFSWLLQGASQQAERWVKSAYIAWLETSGSRAATPASLLTVTELRTLAHDAENQRLQHEEQERARKAAERAQQREAYLRRLAADFETHWKVVEQQAERGTSASYDAAASAIVNLADAYALAADRPAFEQALKQFMLRHGKRKALLRRLEDAGLW